jgi:hypothetical protein
VVLPYTVGGSATNPGDHDAVDGAITINSCTTGSLVFHTVDNGVTGEVNDQVVIFQPAPISEGAVYRKYHFDRGWQDFVVDSHNGVASAPGSRDRCAEPGADDYRSGLNTGDYSVQLTLEDGGPNDADGRRQRWRLYCRRPYTVGPVAATAGAGVGDDTDPEAFHIVSRAGS